MEISLKGQILQMWDADGNYNGPTYRILVVDGEPVNIDDYAAEHGFTLPDS
jgi:hypothetical protein